MSESSTPPSVAYRSFGVELIAEERQRHITAEGWTPESDARYTNEQLARAAVCYALPRLMREMEVYETLHDGLTQGPVPRLWPWQRHFWKPTHRDRMRELVKAGALIAAEIDRLHAHQKASECEVDYCTKQVRFGSLCTLHDAQARTSGPEESEHRGC